MSKQNRSGDMEEIFEILVTSYSQKGGVMPGEKDLYWRPATDVYETNESFIVQMDLAGMDPSQIEVLADEKILLVRGIRQEDTGPGKKHFHEMEISVGPFARRIPITVEVDVSSARAQYRTGFLFVTFAKGRGEAGRQRQIDING